MTIDADQPQQLPDDFQDWYNETFGMAASANVESHMHRKLFHAVWLLMLDEDLMHAYLYGDEQEFWDKVVRLVFLRFFTYSLDYLEKCDSFPLVQTHS